jgi:hypothetical protein
MVWIEECIGAPFYGGTTGSLGCLMGGKLNLPFVSWSTGAGRICANAMLTKWFSSTRLETRTKESNIYASIWVENPGA